MLGRGRRTSTSEADDVDEDAGYVCCVCSVFALSMGVEISGNMRDEPEVDSVGVPVPRLSISGVEILDAVMATPDEPVVGDLGGEIER